MATGEFLLYTTEDGVAKLEVRLTDDTVRWGRWRLASATVANFAIVQLCKLDEFLRVSERKVLDHAGTVSHEQALQKAEIEFEKYRQQLLNEVSPVERHFEEAVKKLKLLERERPKLEGKGRGETK